MRIDISHHYDASPTTVHAMLSDPAFWQFALEGQAESVAVSAVPDGVSMQLGAKAPSQVRAITGDTLQFTLAVTWAQGDGVWSGPIEIDAGKLPGSFTGTSTIGPDASGTKVTYGGDFTIKIPLVGGKIEQKAVPYMTAALDGQQAKGVEWLATH